MKKVIEVLTELYNFESPKSDIKRLEDVINVLNKENYYLVLENFADKKIDIFNPLKEEKELNITILNNEKQNGGFICAFIEETTFYAWEKKYCSDRKVHPRGCSIMNLKNLMGIAAEIIKKDKAVEGIAIQYSIDESVILERELIELLHEKVKSSDEHILIEKNHFTDVDIKGIKENLSVYVRRGFEDISSLWYKQHENAEEHDTLIIECPIYYASFYKLMLKNLIDAHVVNSDILKIVHISESDEIKNIAIDLKPFYQRDNLASKVLS